MKSLKTFCLMVAVAFSTIVFAKQPITDNASHKINGYKYICMENQGNQYDLEDKFNAFFESIGFIVLTEEDEENLDEEEKIYVLYGSYQCSFATNEDGTMSNLTFTLRNAGGKIIFSSSKGGYALMSPRRGFKKASNKIIKQLDELNYSFDPTLEVKNKKSKTDNAVKPAEEEKIKLARQMKADGMTIEQIEKYTGIKAEEIEKL